MPGKDGTRPRDHLEKMAYQKGKRPAALDSVVIPDGWGLLWDIFGALSARRGNSGFGPQPLTFMEIESWARLFQVRLSVMEVRLIEAMDGAFMRFIQDKNDN